MIKVLSQETINKIAAGEVVERPSSVVKELVENAIDAGATAVTIEIKDGGLSFIRITDNGLGIEKDDVPTAFIRHATSKIMTIDDLIGISSLGFRGEALASISAVAQIECITKTAHDLTGLRYEIHGGKEIAKDEIGAPTGTTLIIRNLFYNVPARKKFLKTPTTEGSYITELVTRLALSKPEISFKYIINGTNKIATSGNGKLKDVIYHIYGKDVSANLLPIKRSIGAFSIEGYIGKPFVSKGNRGFEHYFVNGRYIRSHLVTKAIEEAYKSFVMVHKFPFTSFHLTLDSQKLDVNVHPAKMEFKYADGEELFEFVKESVREALLQKEMIPDVSLRSKKEQKEITIERQRASVQQIPEPFEQEARAKRYEKAFREKEEHALLLQHTKIKDVSQNEESPKTSIAEKKIEKISSSLTNTPITANVKETRIEEGLSNQSKEQDNEKQQKDTSSKQTTETKTVNSVNMLTQEKNVEKHEMQQVSLPLEQFLSEKARKSHHMIGQLFKTYWMIEYEEKLYIVDQHAAHEKVMFERLMKQMSEKGVLSQQLYPPKVLHLNSVEHNMVMTNMTLFEQTGFDLEDFGDDSIVIRAMPDDIMGVEPQQLFDALLESLINDIGKISIDFFVEKLSTMACKAAIKGNSAISYEEADALIDELLKLENPYNCPHGRPTMITLTKTELERKFKRIQN